MAVLIVFTTFVVLVMGGVGLLLSGVSAMKQARLAKRMLKMRQGRTDSEETEIDG